jgi:tetratricopeptide (TPR) repeat protein
VQLDPDFAAAYASMGVVYRNFGQIALAQESFKKAFQLRDRVSERERFFIESSYYSVTTGQMEQANQTYLEWAREYSNKDSSAYGNLGNNYIALGDYDKALQATREALRVSGSPIWSGNMIVSYISLGQIDEARAVLDQALAHDPNDGSLHLDGYYLAFLSHDDAKMQEHAAWASGKPGFEDWMFAAESDTAAYYGRLSEADDLTQRAIDSANRNDEKESAAFWQASEALRQAEFGDSAAAHRTALHALSLNHAPGVKLAAALAIARSGDAGGARKLADGLNRDFPVDTLIQAYWLPTIRSAIELDSGRPSRAIELLKQTQPYELAQTLQFDVATMYPVYLRGLAYLRAGQSEQAFAEFRKIVDHRHAAINFPIASLAYLQLARAREANRDREGSRRAYQDFFTVWKDADPDIPILRQAKEEYAKLQ